MLKRKGLAAPAGAKQAQSPMDDLLNTLEQARRACRDPLRCISCGNPVTSTDQRFALNDNSDFHFVNPAGYQFDICVYRDALGCYASGEANHRHSWFASYSWQHAQCEQCDLHLGWYYSNGDDDAFWGLISALLTKS
jgi:hypothetical protein